MSVVVGPDSMSVVVGTPLDISLENIHTHQCEFTRGYWIGYVQRELEAGIAEELYVRVPEAYVDDVLMLLPPAAEVATHLDEPSEFGVRFADITMTIPPAYRAEPVSERTIDWAAV